MLPRRKLNTTVGSQEATNATTMAISMRFVRKRRLRASLRCSVKCSLPPPLSRFSSIPYSATLLFSYLVMKTLLFLVECKSLRSRRRLLITVRQIARRTALCLKVVIFEYGGKLTRRKCRTVCTPTELIAAPVLGTELTAKVAIVDEFLLKDHR